MTFTFRAIWPITNERLPFIALCAQARHDIPLLLGQAHARPVGGGRWTLAESVHVPGSGRVTPWVLIYECPAHRVPVRVLPQIPAVVASTPATAGPRPAAGVDGEVALQPATTHGQEGTAA
ncbi:hypothetical protein [Nocardioides sp. PD653]|uniref:hypothetical protein n=1 Tax=Nocardioides sp. PD653 TaxID=393303 RepID=UPI0009F07096|nr:hypothetical protein [Nocardioides sp. PD653]GAW54709.1 hypothetical protein PD653_2123 [Nocardioides sp. PD653]